MLEAIAKELDMRNMSNHCVAHSLVRCLKVAENPLQPDAIFASYDVRMTGI